ncbi:MAG: DUF2269 family protein [Gammaproteobacteria bacterium]
MHEMYFGIKWLHIIGACIGFGSNVTHLFWILSANRDPMNRANILRLVKKIDDYMAIPAYIVTISAGMTMWLWKWPTNTSWIVVSLILSTVLTLMGISFGPFMKRWIRMAREHPDDTLTLTTWSRRLTIWWAAIAGSVFVIIFLMVRKPMLW